jgi:hypothetical protein
MPRRQYQYQPLTGLDQIQLLHIVPGSLNAPIHVKLVEISIKQAENYVALSYVWGDPEPLHNIFIDGQRLEIRQNLLGALWRFRKQGTLIIWADAICINQGDDQERGDQILLMRQIYETAHKVVFYLGEVEREKGEELHALLNLLYSLCGTEPRSKEIQIMRILIGRICGSII